MNRKLLVIGLDGYEASIGERLMREGRLPTLAKLTQRSACVHLDHGAAKRTGLAWEHFSTGLAPEAANRWSAVEFDPLTYRCSQIGTALRPFPGALAANTVVFDSPYFDLGQVPDVQGLVSWGAHDPGTPLRSNPSGLLREIRARFGDYPAAQWIYGFTWPSATRTKEMGSALVEAVRVRTEIARWLLTERLPDWSLGIVVVSELHSASEALWHGVDEHHRLYQSASAPHAGAGLEKTYEAVDALVGTLVSSCPDAAVLAFSMHGMGPNESDVGSMVLLPEFMYRRHFKSPLMVEPEANRVARTDTPQMDEQEAWSEHLRQYFPSDTNESLRARVSFAQRIRRWIPDPAKQFLKWVLRRPTGRLSSTLGWMPADWYAKYWPQMDAFAIPSFYDGQIRVNLIGREASGRVALHSYQEACDRIENDLRRCIDPNTGQSVVAEVIRSRCNDPSRMGPTEADLIVVWAGSQSAFVHPDYGSIGPCPYRRPGGHTGDHGIAWFSDADARSGFHGSRSAFDVVPTIAEFVTGSVPPEFSGESFLSLICRGESPGRA